MRASTMQIRLNRRTGEEISRQIIETFDISEADFAERVVRARMGKSPEEAAQLIWEEIYGPSKSADQTAVI